VRRRIRPAARRLSKRTGTKHCPGMALPFPPHPSTHWQRVRCTLSIWQPESECHEGREETGGKSSYPSIGHAVALPSPCGGNVPSWLNAVLSPCDCQVQGAWWRPIYLFDKREHKANPGHALPCRMVIHYAFAPKSLPCNHLRISFALVLPRSCPMHWSHGTRGSRPRRRTANTRSFPFNDAWRR
jgi:hypothetical protein